jgi:hypothetical protein
VEQSKTRNEHGSGTQIDLGNVDGLCRYSGSHTEKVSSIKFHFVNQTGSLRFTSMQIVTILILRTCYLVHYGYPHTYKSDLKLPWLVVPCAW